MRSAANQKIADAVEKLVAEGRGFISQMVEASISRRNITDTTRFVRWCASCRNLLRLLGPYAQPFEMPFRQTGGFDDTLSGHDMLGSIEALQDAVKDGLLVPMASILRAEVFSDLLEQAEHLLAEGYFLPAGVLGRGVLEDHLRTWCHRAACVPAKAKPTLADFNGELYKAKHLTLTDMKFVEAMAAIGNEAAHNLTTLTAANVKRLLSDVQRFMALHPLP